MKRYEITIYNGAYPMSRVCDTIAEAYGCLETLHCGLLHEFYMDLDEVMCLLASMRNGGTTGHNQHGWSITVHEDEE